MSTQDKNVLRRVFTSEEVDSRYELEWLSLVGIKVALFAVIFLIPFVMAIWLSLHEWNPIAADKPFVGLSNYAQLFSDTLFHNAIINTAGYAAALVFVGIPISLFLAVLLDSKIRGTQIYSAAIFLPVVTSWVVVSLIWMFIFNPDFGVLNRLLEAVGLPTLEWLRSTETALASIALMSIWKNIGFNMVIFLAGLQSIPDSYYEAARIDGANAWERFRYITLPLLKPTTFFVVVVTMIGSFRLFTQVFVMTEGGPVYSSYSIVFYFYRKGFQQFEMGYASAMAVVLFVIVFVLSIIQQRTWGEDVEY